MADSYNELFGLGSHSEDAALQTWYKLQDDAASTTVVDSSSNGNDATLHGGDNTEDIVTTGPASWLSSALALDGSSDYIQSLSAISVNDFTLLGRFNRTTTSGEDYLFSLGYNNSNSFVFYWQTTEPSADVGYRYFFTPLGFTEATGINNSAGEWVDYSISRSGSTVDFGVGDSSYSNTDQDYNYTINQKLEVGFAPERNKGSAYFHGAVADVAMFSRSLSSAEKGEWRNGPEPLNATAPTLSINASTWSGTVGTWGAQSNGSLTYEWELRDADDDSVIESGTGSSPNGSGSYSGDYYLWVRASNDGGYDASENSVSAIAATGTIVPQLLLRRHRLSGGLVI